MERFSRLLDDLYFTNSTNAKEAIFLVIKTLANLDFSKPCGFLERAKDLGFSTDELKNMKSAIIKSKGVIEDIEDSSVRDNLYVLKYNSHTSAVALDVTPSPLIKIQAPIVKSMLDFFIKYHINTTQQFISVLRNAKDWGSTISGMASYSLMGMPANMALNYMMGCIYHGGTYNPFDSYKDGMAFVGESMLGQVSRIPMMVLASFTAPIIMLNLPDASMKYFLQKITVNDKAKKSEMYSSIINLGTCRSKGYFDSGIDVENAP